MAAAIGSSSSVTSTVTPDAEKPPMKAHRLLRGIGTYLHPSSDVLVTGHIVPPEHEPALIANVKWIDEEGGWEDEKEVVKQHELGGFPIAQGYRAIGDWFIFRSRWLFLQELCSFAHTAESQVMPDGAVHLTQIGAAQLPAWGTTTYTQEHMRQHIQATMTTGNHEHKVVHVFSTDPAMSWFHLHATFPPAVEEEEEEEDEEEEENENEQEEGEETV